MALPLKGQAADSRNADKTSPAPSWEALRLEVDKQLHAADYTRVPAILDKMLAAARKYGDDDFRTAVTLRQIGDFYMEQLYDTAKAKAAFSQELALHEKIGLEFDTLAWDVFRLGQIELNDKHCQEAIRYFQRAAKITGQPGYNSNPTPATALAFLLAAAIMDRNEPLIKETQSRIEEQLSKGDLAQRALAADLAAGGVAASLPRLELADNDPRRKRIDSIYEQYLERSERLFRQIFSNHKLPVEPYAKKQRVPWQYSVLLMELAVQAARKKDYARAEDYCKRSCAWRTAGGGKPSDTFYEVWQLAKLKGMQGKSEEELIALKNALSLARKAGTAGLVSLWDILGGIGDNYWRAGKKEEARRYYRQAMAEVVKIGSPSGAMEVTLLRCKRAGLKP